METLEEYLNFAKDIAEYAGKVMIKYFKQNNGASYKGDKTIVTLAVFSLALVIKVKSTVGVVFDPFTDSLCTDMKGQGAYKNGEKITVNNYELDDMKTVCHYDLWPKAV